MVETDTSGLFFIAAIKQQMVNIHKGRKKEKHVDPFSVA